MPNLFNERFFIIFALCVLDFIFGFAKAWANKEIESHKMKLGGLKIAGELCILVVSNYIEKYVGDGVSLSVFIYYLISELISLIENLNAIGIKTPKFLNDKLKGLEDDTKEE